MTTLIETVISEETLNVDADAGIIRNVKVLGSKSKNGRDYLRTAMQDAVRLYEGTKVNIDHPPRSTPGIERGFSDGFGELRECRLGDNEVRADLHFIKAHPLAPVVVESAQRFPKQFGLSHNAEGETTGKPGSVVVESLSLVRSVDIVSRPATNEGLFESENDMADKTKVKTVKQILASAPDGEHKKRLAALVEQEDVAPELAVEAPAEPASDPNEDVKIALSKAAQGIVKKMIDGDLDKNEGFKKLRELLGMAEKAATDSGSPGGGTPAASDAATESVQEALAELRRERAIEKAEKLLESKGIEATDARVKTLVETKDEGIRKELLELWPRKADKKRPVLSPGILESEEDELPFWCQS